MPFPLYTNPLKVDDDFEVITTLDEYENRLVHGFKIISNSRVCFKSVSVQVAFNNETKSMEFIMPEAFRSAVESFLGKISNV